MAIVKGDFIQILSGKLKGEIGLVLRTNRSSVIVKTDVGQVGLNVNQVKLA